MVPATLLLDFAASAVKAPPNTASARSAAPVVASSAIEKAAVLPVSVAPLKISVAPRAVFIAARVLVVLPGVMVSVLFAVL